MSARKDTTHESDQQSTVGLSHMSAHDLMHPDQCFYNACLAPDLDRVALDDWNHTRQAISCMVIHPEATFRKFWDVGSVFLILYSCVTVPYFLALGDEPEGSVWVIDKIVDALFMLDIMLNFITAKLIDTDDGPVLITDFGGIAKEYLRGWFFPDFMSSFPFDLVFAVLYGSENVDPEALRMAKLGRMARMLKILRMVRIKRLLARLQYAMGLKNGAVDIVSFFIVIAFVAHFNACAFYVYGEASEPATWSKAYCVNTPVDRKAWDEFYKNVALVDVEGTKFVSNSTMLSAADPAKMDQLYPAFDSDPFECACGIANDCDDKETRYWSSFYWSIVTMTTVGYGDVLPITHDERGWCLFAMGISAVIFAFAMTSICTFIININQNDVYKQSRFDELIGYMHTCKVNHNFQRRAIEYFGYKTGDKSLGAFYNFESITAEEFRTESARDVFETIYGPFMVRVPLWNSCNKGLFRDLCRHLHLNVYGPKDVVCVKNMLGSGCDMHILAKGKLGVVHPDTEEVIEGHNVYGTAALFGLKSYPSTVIATDFSDVYSLNAVVFREVIRANQINVLQFEVDMQERGFWTENHPYMCKYDDWKPHGASFEDEIPRADMQETGTQVACHPRLGDWATGQFDDLSQTAILKKKFASPEEEMEELAMFDRRQRAFISKLLLTKRRLGTSDITTVGLGEETDSEGLVIAREEEEDVGQE